MAVQYRVSIPAVQEKIREYKLLNALIIVIEMNKIDIYPVYQNFLLEPNIRSTDFGIQHIIQYFTSLLMGEGHPREVQSRAKKFYINQAYVRATAYGRIETEKIVLPDGSAAETEALSQCNELLFDPMLGGYDMDSLPEVIDEAVNSCDLNIRKPIKQNIVIWHRNMDVKDLETRLEKELKDEFSPDYKIVGSISTEGIMKRFE